MISIIICSRNDSLAKKLSVNIEASIGQACEIIIFDNREAKLGLCEVYNICAEKSKFSILCFAHEDIIFHTRNWGSVVTTILADETIGLIGVAGTSFLSKHNTGWHLGGETTHMYYLQRIEENGKSVLKDQNMDHKSLKEVVVLDGLWLCTRKEVWKKNRFDQQLFRGFHFYDLDFSLQIHLNFKVYVTNELLIEHASAGNFDDQWIADSFVFKKKWQSRLPVYVTGYSSSQLKKLNILALQAFSRRLIANDSPKRVVMKALVKSILARCYNLRSWRILLYYLSSSPFLTTAKSQLKNFLSSVKIQ